MVGDWRTLSVSLMLDSLTSPKWKLVGELVRISSMALASFIVNWSYRVGDDSH